MKMQPGIELKQFEEVRQAARDAELSNIRADIVEKPSRIYEVDPVTGLNWRQKFISKFDNTAKGEKAWHDLVQDVGELIYLEGSSSGNISQGIDRATAFYERIGRKELKDSPKHLKGMLSNIKRWQNEAVRAYNSSRQVALMQQREEREARYDAIGRYLERARINNQIVPREELDQLALIGDPKDVHRYYQDIYGDIDKQAEPAEIERQLEVLESTATNGFRTPDGKSVRYAYKKARLDPAARALIEDFAQDLTDPQAAGKFKQVSEAITAWTTPTLWEKGLADNEYAELRLQAKQEAKQMLRGGQTAEQVIAALKPRYDKTVVKIKRLPPLPDGSRPDTPASVIQKMKAIRDKLNLGKITKDEYATQVQLLDLYSKAVMQNQQKGAENE